MPLGGQQPDCVLAVITCQLNKLIQDQLLSVSICRLIALADCSRQISARSQLDLSPHFALRGAFTLGSIFNEATTLAR
jgi:hypothetical protein